jgi:hypothetical protein
MKKGRIGIARRVHVIKIHDEQKSWGVSLCGGWSGHVRLAAPYEKITCRYCLSLMDQDDVLAEVLSSTIGKKVEC